MRTDAPANGTEDPVSILLAERGFDLRQITWGYQGVFRDTIAELARRRLLGAANGEVTRAFFDVLSHADKSTFDSVLRSFLEAIRGEYRWVMRLPRLFERWSKTGIALARHRHFLGMRFFELTGEGRLGKTPEELEFALDLVSLLKEKEIDLVSPLLQGYEYLCRNLGQPEVREFVLESWRLYHRNPQTARGFLTCELRSARLRIEQMTRQADLAANRDALERLAHALIGRHVEVASLSQLDSDDVQERGPTVVACGGALYLPAKIVEFPGREQNTACLKAFVTIAAATQLARGFSVVHGTGSLETCRDLFRAEEPAVARLMVTCFVLAETRRVLAFCDSRFPGLRKWLRRLRDLELARRPVRTLTDALFAHCLDAPGPPLPDGAQELLELVRTASAQSRGCAATRRCLLEARGTLRRLAGTLPDLPPPRPLCFFPDPLFPLTISEAGGGKLKLDLHDNKSLPAEDAEQEALPAVEDDTPATITEQDGDTGDSGTEDADGDDAGGATVGYFYDEWNVHCGDYYRHWCCVHERRPPAQKHEASVPPDVQRYAAEVRSVFERLKPEEIRVETRLHEGDRIHLDHFVEYVSQRDIKRDTEMRFYNKPLIQKRDVAVAVLLDLSGSTADKCPSSAVTVPVGARHSISAIPELGSAKAGKTVLEVEKEAAFVLCAGLASLGDSFGLFGFTGTGRENCLFYKLKPVDEPWDSRSVRSLLGAAPGSSTRIGPALRHTGWRLGQWPAKTRLLLLMTDGRPCDQGYDTETHYAHHDVRKACQENLAKGIHTFCVSTSENTPADMELMFPGGRYLILEDISRLPAVLSRLYLKLTR